MGAMEDALAMAQGAASDEPETPAAAPETQELLDTQASEPETPVVTPEQQPTIHPAMQELLDKIPESFRPAVATPLQEWQKSADENLRKVHSEYEPYKPFRENNVPVEDLQAGIALVNAMRADPRRVFDQMQAYYKFAVEQGQEDVENETDYDDPQEDVDPRLLQLQQSQEQIQNMLAQQAYDQEVAQASQEIDTIVEKVKTDHQLTPAAERFVVKEAVSLLDQYPNEPIGKIFDAAVSTYKEFAGEIAPKNPGPPAPAVPRGNSSLPSTVVDPAELDASGRKSAALEMARLLQNGG